MRSWWVEGDGFRIALVEAVDIHPAVFDIGPVVVADVVGVACAGTLIGSHLFDNSPLHWGPLCCLVPCRFPFAENVGCLDSDNLPAIGIVAIAGVFAAMSAISVFLPLVMPDIDSGGAKVARLYYCSGVAPLFVAFACAIVVVVASSWRLLLVLLGPQTPFETGVHSQQPVVLNFVLLLPRCGSLS